MTELREWFLIMLYLHPAESLKHDRGGSPHLYAKIMRKFRGNDGEDDYKMESSACAHVMSLFFLSKYKGTLNDAIRMAFHDENPPLITELAKGGYGAVLFTLTEEGKERAKNLVSGLSEACRGAIQQTIVNMRLSKQET